MFHRIANYAVDVAIALLIFAVGWWLAGALARWVQQTIIRAGGEATAAPLISTALRWAIRVVTTVMVLGKLGVQTTSIVAALGAAGLAIGLALQGTLQNIAAGLMLLLLRPFRLGDYIEGSGGVAGTVAEVGLFTTRLVKLDGSALFVPNSQLWSNAVTNFSSNPSRRIEVSVNITTAQIMPGLALAQDIVSDEPHVLAKPEPTVTVADYTDTGARLSITAWVATAHYATVRATLLRRLRPEIEAALALPTA
ncbi:MAG TPA: mechanosensitive ion channel family protein [Chitinolyticbacter sp.]|nr:mechanosensitive ion channel family protein [Chitinolyticbacter sp.]